MKKVMFFFIILPIILTSCYPPRIIYAIEDIQPSLQKDSVDVQLIKGSITSAGIQHPSLNMYLKMNNNKNSNIIVKNNSVLELRTDSIILKYEISSDSLTYLLLENEKKLLNLHFQATDSGSITYKTVDWPSIWNFRILKAKNPLHKLFLFLDLQDNKGNKIEKCIILKPIGTKRMRYEEPPTL